MASFDESTAECLVYSFKDGLLSPIAHDLKLSATRFTIDVGPQLTAVQASIDAQSLRVQCVMKGGLETEGGLSDADKRKVERQIIEDVLEAKKHPSIVFRSTSVERVAQGFRLEGVVRMHGVEWPIVSSVRREHGHYRADLTLHQPNFGIKPYAALFGTLKVKPGVLVRLSVPADDQGGLAGPAA